MPFYNSALPYSSRSASPGPLLDLLQPVGSVGTRLAGQAKGLPPPARPRPALQSVTVPAVGNLRSEYKVKYFPRLFSVSRRHGEEPPPLSLAPPFGCDTLFVIFIFQFSGTTAV